MYDRSHSAQIKQAEPLSVELVGIVDRYLVGGVVFAIFSRSRWSDLKNLQSIWIDSFEDGSGFVEARTMDHKTSHTVQTKRCAMPLVAPFPGVSEHPWVRSWWAAGEALGVVWARSRSRLWSVPDRNGKLCERRYGGRQSAVSSLRPCWARQAHVALPQGHHPQLGGKTGLARERQPPSRASRWQQAHGVRQQ